MFTQKNNRELVDFFGGKEKIDKTYNSYHPNIKNKAGN